MPSSDGEDLTRVCRRLWRRKRNTQDRQRQSERTRTCAADPKRGPTVPPGSGDLEAPSPILRWPDHEVRPREPHCLQVQEAGARVPRTQRQTWNLDGASNKCVNVN